MSKELFNGDRIEILVVADLDDGAAASVGGEPRHLSDLLAIAIGDDSADRQRAYGRGRITRRGRDIAFLSGDLCSDSTIVATAMAVATIRRGVG